MKLVQNLNFLRNLCKFNSKRLNPTTMYTVQSVTCSGFWFQITLVSGFPGNKVIYVLPLLIECTSSETYLPIHFVTTKSWKHFWIKNKEFKYFCSDWFFFCCCFWFLGVDNILKAYFLDITFWQMLFFD